ncbi:MAG: amino acid racemase [Pseudomonadota bacterium]
MTRPVGILGGMGPAATVLLMRKVIAAVPGRDDADHIPLLVDQNPQVPSRIAWLIEGRGEDPGPVLARMAQRLEAMGAEALAMPCNTAHHFVAQIRNAVDIPLLDMVDLTIARIRERADAGSPIGILASPAIRKTALFDKALAAIEMRAIYPEDQDGLLDAIRRIKSAGRVEPARAALAEASADLRRRGAKTQLIACTEFSTIAEAVTETVQTIDTLDRLVEAIISFSTGHTFRNVDAEAAEPA